MKPDVAISEQRSLLVGTDQLDEEYEDEDMFESCLSHSLREELSGEDHDVEGLHVVHLTTLPPGGVSFQGHHQEADSGDSTDGVGTPLSDSEVE